MVVLFVNGLHSCYFTDEIILQLNYVIVLTFSIYSDCTSVA
jgi:hypothetical protein